MARTLQELEIWQLARQFVDAISAILQRPAFRSDLRLRDQLSDSSTSVMSNVGEGFGQRTDRGFASCLGIARGSNNEAVSQLAIAQGRAYITESEYKELEELSNRMGRKITALMKYLDRADRKQRG